MHGIVVVLGIVIIGRNVFEVSLAAAVTVDGRVVDLELIGVAMRLVVVVVITR